MTKVVQSDLDDKSCAIRSRVRVYGITRVYDTHFDGKIQSPLDDNPSQW